MLSAISVVKLFMSMHTLLSELMHSMSLIVNLVIMNLSQLVQTLLLLFYLLILHLQVLSIAQLNAVI